MAAGTTDKSAAALAATQKRTANRKRVLKAGIIAFSGRCSTLTCLVRDLSEKGARLQLEGSVDAPDTFELIIEMDGMEADCRVLRRRKGEIAVEFVNKPRIAAPKRTQVVTIVDPRSKPTLRRKSVGA